VAKGWDQTAWVDIEKGLRFLIGIDLDVLIRNLLKLKRNPDTLNEGAIGTKSISDSMYIQGTM